MAKVTKQRNYSMARADIDRIHQRIDDTQKTLSDSTARLNVVLTDMAVRMTELATTVKNWPQPKARPCEFFQAHEAEHKKMETAMVLIGEHIAEAKEVKADIRREGIGLAGKVIFYIVGGLMLLGIGAFINHEVSKPKIGVTVSK